MELCICIFQKAFKEFFLFFHNSIFLSLEKKTFKVKYLAQKIAVSHFLQFTITELPLFRRLYQSVIQPADKAMAPTPVLLPGKAHGRRSLVGCSPWGRKESDTTERLPFHVSLSCIGEGNGSPLQCSCLENPRDGGAWRAAVCGVARSRTRLKRLSSSSSSVQAADVCCACDVCQTRL